MEAVISKLLKDFEDGKMSRRQLVQSLAMAAAAVALPGRVGAAPQATAASGTPVHFKAVAVDHISFQVHDYKATRDFYADLLGMTVSDDDGARQCYLHFGDQGSFLLPRNGGARSRPSRRRSCSSAAFSSARRRERARGPRGPRRSRRTRGPRCFSRAPRSCARTRPSSAPARSRSS